MRTLRNIIGIGLAAALSLSGVLGTAVHAIDPPLAATISPVDYHHTVDPGQVITEELIFLNNGQTAYDFVVYAAPFSVDDKYRSNFDDATRPRADAYRWVQFTQTKWHVGPRETVHVPFTITVDKNASPGGHYGTIFAEVQPDSSEGSISRKKRLGAILYTTVKGEVIQGGEVRKIATAGYHAEPMISSVVSVTNTGNTDYKLDTELTVSDLFGNKMHQATGVNYVFPSSIRDVTVSWDSAPWFGVYKVKVSATALGKTTTQESVVFIAPYWLFVLLGLGILLGAIDVLRRQKRRKTARRRHTN